MLADRGFPDSGLFEFLETLGFEYVIRPRGNYLLASAGREKRKGGGLGGRARTLRDASVTDKHRWKAAMVAYMKDRDMKEPWCLRPTKTRR